MKLTSVSLHTAVPFNKIKANPFRDMERYPVDNAIIKDLMGSMDRNGFWPNLIGRKVNGFVELAYGHHRWIAFGKKFGEDTSMNIMLEDIDDAQMLRYMADENMPEMGGKAAIVEQGVVRAVVLAYAEGKIEMEKPKALDSESPKARSTGIRLAPSFLQTDLRFKDIKTQMDAKPYTAESIAQFLGWLHPGGQASARVRNALKALEAMENEIVEEEDMKDLSSNEAKKVVQQARKVQESHQDNGATSEQAKEKARTTAKKVATKMRTQKKKAGRKPESTKPKQDKDTLIEKMLSWASQRGNVTPDQLATKFDSTRDTVVRWLNAAVGSRGYLVEDINEGEYRVKKAVHFSRMDGECTQPGLPQLMKELHALALEASILDGKADSTEWPRRERIAFLQKVLQITGPFCK